MKVDKDAIAKIFRAPIALVSEMEQDSQNFRAHNKENQSSLNTGKIPVQESFAPTSNVPSVAFNNLMSNLTRHIARGLVELPSYVNIKEVNHPLAIRIAYETANKYLLRLEKVSSKQISTSEFHNVIAPLLNQRMSTIQFNAQQESISAFLDYLHDYQTLWFIFQGANEREYIEFQMRLDKLEREYIASCSEISVFLNYINFYGFRDYGCYVDLLFTCNSCC